MPNFDESLLKPVFDEALLKPERRSGVLSEFGMSEEPSKEELAGAAEWLTSPLLKIKPPTPEEAAGLMSPIGFPIRRVPRPAGPTPPAADVALGLLEADIGAVSGLTAPMNIAMAPAMGVPGVAPVAGAVFGGQALGAGLGELSVAIPQGDWRGIGRGSGSALLGGGLGFAGVKGVLDTVALPRAAEALAEEPGAEPPETAPEPAPTVVPPESAQPAPSAGAQPEVPDVSLRQRETEVLSLEQLPSDRPQVDPQIRLGAQGQAPPAQAEVPAKAEDVTVAEVAKPPKPAPAEPAEVPTFARGYDPETLFQRPAWVEPGSALDKALGELRERGDPYKGLDVTDAWRALTPTQRQDLAARGWVTSSSRVADQVLLKLSDAALDARRYYRAQKRGQRRQAAEPAAKPSPEPLPNIPTEIQNAADVWRKAEKSWRRAMRQGTPDERTAAEEAKTEAELVFRSATEKTKMSDKAYERLVSYARKTETERPVPADAPTPPAEAQAKADLPALAVVTGSHRQVEHLNRAIPKIGGGISLTLGSKDRVWEVPDTPENRAIVARLGLRIHKGRTQEIAERQKQFGALPPEVPPVPGAATETPPAPPAEPTIPVIGLREADSTPMALGKLRKSDPARHADILRFFGAKNSAQAAKAAALRFAEIRNAPPPGSSVHLQGPDLPDGPRPFGIVVPSSIPFHRLVQALSEPISSAASWMRELWRGFAMKQAPKLTDADRPTGEAAVRYASSYLVAKAKGLQFARQVLEGTGIPEHKFGVALSEDNLRGVRDGLIRAGKPAEAAKVVTLIGRPHSPFATEAEYQSFLADPATQLAVQRHKQLWVEQKDPLFRQANDLDPDAPLASRGRQTGARVNLNALLADDPGVRAVGRPGLPGFRQLASLKRRDPFAQRAKGTGAVYEGSYDALMANSFEREMPIAAQHEFIRTLIDSGNAIVKDKEFEKGLELRGEGTTGRLMRLNPWRGKFLHVRRSLLDEYDAINGLEKPASIPVLTPFNRWLTRMSIQGLAEGSTHAANLLNEAFTGLGPTSHPLINALLKSLGRVDLLYRIPSVVLRGFSEAKTRPEMISLMERGAAKQPYKRGFLGVGAVLNAVDRGARLTSESIYKGMAREGWVEDTETGLREFVNQVGNYNKRLQPRLIRALRDTGIQPFATAGQTFNVLGLRRMVFAPGAKAASNGAALALRADIAAGWLGAAVLVTVLNKLVSGTATGPKGTPLGAVGWIGDDGKVRSLNIGRLMGFSRGLEHTGIKPAIEAARAGLPPSEQVRAAAGALTSTGLSTVMGPGPRAIWTSLTGKRPTQPGVQTAPLAPPTDDFAPFKTQFAKNVETAAIEANPIVGTAVDLYQGKALLDVLSRQFRRYTPVPGRTEQFTERLPAIITRKRIVEYADSLATETRRKPIHDRLEFVQKRFESDDLDPRYRRDVIVELKRHGIFRYE